ncbi:ZIP family metal transporter [Croceibacterium sp. TMG7-5b_MA50]|uniref:ZIP family metal transporter n=1 Tax=Croceibacterium sp. TMG7-5b_MA50 TaxID=3121290 RepID=UPI0032216243
MPAMLLPILFGVLASAATLLGGLLALRLQNRATLVLGLAAGIVLGVALFDLIPEAVELATDRYEMHQLFAWLGLGVGAYLLLHQLPGADRPQPWQAHLGPASLTLHSFIDGAMIGIAFQVSAEIGWLIAAAVLTHDVADGINTVSLSLARSGPRIAKRWLLINGAAPLAGTLAGLLIAVPDGLMAPLLAVFGGVFLYIGACELVPRSHARDPRLRVTLATLAGMVLMWVVTGLAHG